MTDVGHTGEAIAAKYYRQRGWLLLNHNYRTRMGEIDLILYKENTLVFAEVKTRAGTMLDRPAAAVDARKQQRLILAAQQYLQRSPYGVGATVGRPRNPAARPMTGIDPRNPRPTQRYSANKAYTHRGRE